MRPGRTAAPTPRSGPGPRRTRDWGRRTSRPRRVGCEIVASTRCPSLWPNVILKKSHSPTTTGHFDVKTHLRPSPNRCIQVKYDFTARLHGEPAVNVYMDREYMLQFTKQTRKKWLKRSELEAMTSDPSVLDMIKAIQPKMGEQQDKLDKIMYPNVANDAATVRELIGRFEGREGLYALQSGPGPTRRLGLPPFHRLAARVLAFADNY